jgi:hypothetical protein
MEEPLPMLEDQIEQCRDNGAHDTLNNAGHQQNDQYEKTVSFQPEISLEPFRGQDEIKKL